MDNFTLESTAQSWGLSIKIMSCNKSDTIRFNFNIQIFELFFLNLKILGNLNFGEFENFVENFRKIPGELPKICQKIGLL